MISIIIIGNEILSAKVADTNLAHMLVKLNQASYPIDEVRIIRDDIATIRDTVRELSIRSNFVISTGGVGPTHDDVTLEAYAAAFEVPLILHAELEAKIRAFFGDKITPSSLRMARVPANTRLVDMGAKSWPLIKVSNCFVLPGLPEVFVKKFEGVLSDLPRVPDTFYAELRTSSDESDFAVALAGHQTRFPQVELGSYPTYDRTEYAAKVTLSGTDQEALAEVFALLKTVFQEMGSLVDVQEPRRNG